MKIDNLQAVRTAFAYLRVSGLGQVDGLGFDRQLAAIETYAAANSIKIVGVYREEGVTGKSELDGRPALQELILALMSNGTTLVLIEKLDRLARALIVQETILQDLNRRGFSVVSVAEPDLCTDDPTRTLIRQILGSFFEYERKMIVSKLADARRRTKAKNGRCEGVKPYGANPVEISLLTVMVTMKNEGRLNKDIAEELNRRGSPTRHGKRWHSGTISKILRRQLACS